MQKNKLFIGNLSYSITEDELKEEIQKTASPTSVKIIEGKGFGFVEFESDEDADKVREALNNQDFKGRTMRIDFARPKKPGMGGGGNFSKRNDFGRIKRY
ncbi:RNA recognition motif domain-containing protein [bacterium]